MALTPKGGGFTANRIKRSDEETPQSDGISACFFSMRRYIQDMSEIIFKWDKEKNRLNQERHGIAFEDATFVFNDPCKVILPDLYHSAIEER